MTATFSIVNYADLHQELDFDAEHYHPERLAAWGRLSKNANQTVSDYFSEVVDIRDSMGASEVYDLTDAVGFFLSDEGKGSGLSTKKIAKPGDIIVSRLRSYLKEICVIPKRLPGFMPFLSTEFLVFRPKKSDGKWLLPYLLADDVQTIMTWSQTGNNHPRMRASTILELPLPKQVIELKDKLCKLVEEAVNKYESALHVYPEAEAELLDRMKWDELNKNPCELYYIEYFETLNRHERIDAEHYQPKYERLSKLLEKHGAMALGDLLKQCDKGTQPESYGDEGEVIVVKSKDVFGEGIELATCERTSVKAWEDKPARLRDGDAVVNSTGMGTLGRVGVVHYDDDRKVVASVDLLILRVKNDMVDPDYLSLYLNSLPGLAQSEQYQTGSSGQLHIYPDHVKKFKVFVPRNKNGDIDLAWQVRLADKVRQAARAKVDARVKLEEAKTLVEQAAVQ